MENYPAPEAGLWASHIKPLGQRLRTQEFAEDALGVTDHMITGSKLWDSAGGPVGKAAGFHCRGAQAHSLVRELKSHMLLGVGGKKARCELTFLIGVHSHLCVCVCVCVCVRAVLCFGSPTFPGKSPNPQDLKCDLICRWSHYRCNELR